MKQRFVRLLRELLKRNGVQQKELGEKLGITASAASQIFSGAMIPSQPRLDQLFELLEPQLEEAQLLQRMAFWLRSGRGEMPSAANRRLFFLRCRSGLSVNELSWRSGIAVRRLNALENQPGAHPADPEVAALTAVLGADVSEDAASGGRRDDGRCVEVADSERVAMLPLLGIQELRNYDGSERIDLYAARRARGFAECAGVSPDAAAVCTVPAAELGLSGSGVLKLTLGVCAPRGLEKISLCADASGGLFIRGWAFAPVPGSRRHAKWSVPLLEISYLPGRKKI